MCVLYPKTAAKLKKMAMKKHDLIVKYYKKAEKIKSMKLG